jgi:hypothetical protein
VVDNEDDANSYVAKRKAIQNEVYDDNERDAREQVLNCKSSGYKHQRAHHGKAKQLGWRVPDLRNGPNGTYIIICEERRDR